MSPLSRRSLFGLWQGTKNRSPAKTISLEPGYETIARLAQQDDTRPSNGELRDAIEGFLGHWRRRPYMDATRASLLHDAYQHLKSQDAKFPKWAAANRVAPIIRDIVCKTPPKGCRSDAHLALIRALEHTLQDRLASEIEVLALYGRADEARALADREWPEILAARPELTGLHQKSWHTILQGFVLQEATHDELCKTVETCEKHDVPFDFAMQQEIVHYFACVRSDLDHAKYWYERTLPTSSVPTVKTALSAIQCCIKHNSKIWGDQIVKSVIRNCPDDKQAWDMALCWAAASGQGVEGVGKLIQSIRQLQKPPIQPDISSINALVAFASEQNDAYTAERFIALGRELGLTPDMHTYRLQIEYRLKGADVSGALAAFEQLREEGIRTMAHASDSRIKRFEKLEAVCRNQLIAAMCDEMTPRYDEIMCLVDELTDAKMPFLPKTVASLVKLHVNRNEISDIEDLLQTHALSYTPDHRQMIDDVVLQKILDPRTSDDQAWQLYHISRRFCMTSANPIVMQNFFERGRSDLAVAIFSLMRKCEVRPDEAVYARCLTGIARAVDTVNLKTVHNMMRIDTAIEPTTLIRNAFMLAYSCCGQPNRALDFWNEIEQSPEGPSLQSIRIVLHACQRADRGSQIARAIWQKMKRVNVPISREVYASYIGALASRGEHDECIRLCEDAAQEGLQLDALILGAFLNGIQDANERNLVKQWARDSFSDVYRDLLACGTCQVQMPSASEYDLDDDLSSREKTVVFDLDAIGGRLEP